MSPSITALSPSPLQCTTDDNFISSRPTQLKYCSRFQFFYIFLSLYDLMFEYVVEYCFLYLFKHLLACMGVSIVLLGWKRFWCWRRFYLFRIKETSLNTNNQLQRLTIKLVWILLGIFNQRLLGWDKLLQDITLPYTSGYSECPLFDLSHAKDKLIQIIKPKYLLAKNFKYF